MAEESEKEYLGREAGKGKLEREARAVQSHALSGGRDCILQKMTWGRNGEDKLGRETAAGRQCSA